MAFVTIKGDGKKNTLTISVIAKTLAIRAYVSSGLRLSNTSIDFEIDDQKRMVRIKEAKPSHKTISIGDNSMFYIGRATAKRVNLPHVQGSRVKIEMIFNEEDGWWYGSF